MRKVVYNACFGGFSLSREAVLLGRKLSGDPKWGGACIKGDTWSSGEKCTQDFGSIENVPRHDEVLVAVVEQLGDAANGMCARLRIERVDGPYRIDEYDGNESVMTADDYEWIE